MNKPHLLLLLAAALPCLAQAQASLAIGKHAPAIRAVKGVDELGSGLKAVIRLESHDEADTTAWVAGANYTLAPYLRKAPEGLATIRQWSIAYAYPLSKASYGYARPADKQNPAAPERAAF